MGFITPRPRAVVLEVTTLLRAGAVSLGFHLGRAGHDKPLAERHMSFLRERTCHGMSQFDLSNCTESPINPSSVPVQDASSAIVPDVRSPSPAAARMRRHRERRRDGLRCLTIELRETEIDGLIRRGFLKSEMRNNKNAVLKALYAFFDRTIGA